MSSEARLAPSDRSSTDKRASISLATRSLGGTLDMGLVSSPVFSSANHFRGTRPFPFYRHSRTLPRHCQQFLGFKSLLVWIKFAHGREAEVAPGSRHPLILLFHENRACQTNQRSPVWEDPHDIGAAADLPHQTLQWVR